MNLIPSFDKWYSFYPENLLAPDFYAAEDLGISLPKNEYSLGKMDM